MEQHISCSQSNKVAAAQSRQLNPAEQIELICLDNEEFLKGYISDNRFDAEVENQFVEFGKMAKKTSMPSSASRVPSGK